MNNPNMVEWEDTLKKIFDLIDDQLEDRYGCLYALHPARATRNMTSNKSSDGLFNIGATFSAGFGSIYGSGWVVDVTMVTLLEVSKKIKKEIYKEVCGELKRLLVEYYPERDIQVAKDGNVFKIFGKLGLEFHN